MTKSSREKKQTSIGQKRVAFLGTDGGTSFCAKGFDQALMDIGQNTGNALFQFAMWRQIRNPKFTYHPGASPHYVRANADLIVIPSANQVNPAWDLGTWADFIEACDLPVVCIGLGAQAGIDCDPNLELKPGTERYVRSVAAHSDTIGVRGAFTQEVLKNMGIDNTTITGCPSQMINPFVKGHNIQAALDRYSQQEAGHIGYLVGTLEPEARNAESVIASLMRGRDHEVILQTDPRLLRFLHDRCSPEEHQSYISWVGTVMRPDLPTQEFIKYLRERGSFYSDARSWIDHMRRHDLVLGMRIHGVVAAIQAEVLGVCVAFDSRTKELAHTMGYPYVHFQSLKLGMSLQDIVSQSVFSAERFDHLRQVHTDRIIEMLTKAGVLMLGSQP